MKTLLAILAVALGQCGSPSCSAPVRPESVAVENATPDTADIPIIQPPPPTDQGPGNVAFVMDGCLHVTVIGTNLDPGPAMVNIGAEYPSSVAVQADGTLSFELRRAQAEADHDGVVYVTFKQASTGFYAAELMKAC
jgi:hypothetical protein